MAAPVATARGTPAGLKLRNGWQSFITFSLDPTIGLWEIAVTPFGYDGGDKINNTTQHNDELRTYAPPGLIDVTDGQMTCAFDPAAKDDIRAMINQPQTITTTYPDGSTEATHGVLKSFVPQALVDGTMPEATCEFYATNTDEDYAEEFPVIVSVPGT